MIGSFYTGLSGAKTNQFGVDSWSNNVANVNTVGFKANLPRFQSIFSTALTGASGDKGYGATVGSNEMDTSMGVMSNANNSDFNMALGSDNSWFTVGDGNGNQYYTRDGAFDRDVTGHIVNNSGHYLYGIDLGKIVNDEVAPSGNITGDINSLKVTNLTQTEPLRVPETLRFPPVATTNVSVAINLDTTSTLKNISSDYLNKDLNTMYGENNNRLVTGNNENIVLTDSNGGVLLDLTYGQDFNTLQDLIDASGGIISLENGKLKFYNDPANAVDIEIDYNNSSQSFLSALGINANKYIASGNEYKTSTVTIPSASFDEKIYDAQGNESSLQLQYVLNNKTNATESWEIQNNGITVGFLEFSGSDPQAIPTLLNATGASVDNLNISGIVYNPKQFTDEFGDTYNSTNVYSFTEKYRTDTDGRQEGFLDDVLIDGNGLINMHFTNGESEIFGRVGIAMFQNNQGLSKIGSNMVDATLNSGDAITGWDVDGELKTTSILQHKLELSNVQMTTALTELMIMQRGYSASTKSISTADDMVKEALSLKR